MPLYLQPDFGVSRKIFFLKFGGLAQLARALAWHARGHRFDSGNLHKPIRFKTL